MPDTYWFGPTWFDDYNRDWMLRGIDRGDDFYIVYEINRQSLYYTDKDTKNLYGSYFARELNELIKVNIKPINITWDKWN